MVQGQGKSLLEVLEELYRAYGFYESRLLSFSFEGAEGDSRMAGLIQNLREQPPGEIEGYTVEKIVDYQSDPTGLPRSNVLRLFLSGGQKAVVRPSGTEPKLKVYLTAAGEGRAECEKTAACLTEYFENWIERS